MTKVLKILKNSIGIVIEILLLLLIVFAFLIRTSKFQSFLAHKATDYLTEMLGSKVSVGKMDITFFDRVYLGDLYVEDLHKDTLFFIQDLNANFDMINLIKGELVFDDVKVNQAKSYIKKYKDEDVLNLQFFVDGFSTKKEKKSEIDFEINVKKFKLTDSYFIFLDENKPKTPYGVDFTYLNFKNIELDAKNIYIHPDCYDAEINNLSFIDHSGFEIKRFNSEAQFSLQHGLILGPSYIHTEGSSINIETFALQSNSIKDFTTFVDSVQLNATFEKSFVSLEDVSYFAPQLKGMNDVVMISGRSEDVVNNLQLKDITLKYGKGTIIEGDFSLPNFRQLSLENIQQDIRYLSIDVADLEQFKLPDNSSSPYIKWPSALDGVSSIKSADISISGTLANLKTNISYLATNIGTFRFQDKFIIHTDTTFKAFEIETEDKRQGTVWVEDFYLDRLLKNNNLGKTNGTVNLNSVIVNEAGVKVNNINGQFYQTPIYGYSYDNIILKNVNYSLDQRGRKSHNQIIGNVYIRDENIDLSYNGLLAIGKHLEADAQINLECATLSKIHPSLHDRGELITSIDLKAKGTDFNNFVGNLYIDSIFYEENDNIFQTENFLGYFERSNDKDSISITSKVIDAEIYGVVDYKNVFKNISNQFGNVFPAFIPTYGNVDDQYTKFNYDIKFKEINDLLAIFLPSIKISPNATIDGNYNGGKNMIGLTINADYFNYNDFSLKNINTFHDMSFNELLTLIDISSISYKDSILYKKIHFTGLATKGTLDSQILFEDNEKKRSDISWFTILYPDLEFDIFIQPSNFTVFGNPWVLEKQSIISYRVNCFDVENLDLKFNNQNISIYGYLSDSQKDKLYINIFDLELSEFDDLFLDKTDLSGNAMIVGYITTPKNLKFSGEVIVEDFYVNNTEVGRIGMSSDYSADNRFITLFGDIRYKSIETFKFEGGYALGESEEDGKLDINMNFKELDIAVVNEFLDRNFINGIEGKLNGNMNLVGPLHGLELDGTVNIEGGKFNLAILGADMFFEGEVDVDKDGFYINTMPLTDVEGNTGYINGTLFHTYFDDFIFDLEVNLEDHPTKRVPNDPSKPLPVERFLVMNTAYNINSLYYGTGYITGLANISGTLDNLDIDVKATTKKGTKFILPLYGPTTIEEDGFITFKKPDSEEQEDKNVDLSGLNLTLDFNVTNDAEIKMVFDDKTDDEITARGNGNVTLSVDQFNELAMDGLYTVSSGYYNFTFGPYVQKFIITPGGTVQWNGDPFEAILDIEAYYKTMANLSVVMPDVIENQTSNNEEIYSYLIIEGELSNPTISFDIDAPKASESGKAIINRIRADKDVLNQQFFSIIISKSFMPLSGQGGIMTQTSGAILDFATSQINNLLNRFADGYNMNVNLENDDISGQFSGEFGLSKSFLDDRLWVSGSFGVGTRKVNGGEENVPNQNTFIGDVRIEYLLNERGTFRVNAFNESNNNFFLQNEGRGQFTQGIGVSYREDFHGMSDFKLYQFFANIFRKRENRVDLRENRSPKIPIPAEYFENNNKGVLKEEN